MVYRLALLVGAAVACGQSVPDNDRSPRGADSAPAPVAQTMDLVEPVFDTTLPFDEAVRSYVLRSTPARLARGMPSTLHFETWFRNLLGPNASFESETNDCGEQTGDPSRDRGRIPLCLDLVGKRADGWELGVQVYVGTVNGGVAGDPSIGMVYFACGERPTFVRNLADLARETHDLGQAARLCTGYEGLRYPPLPSNLADRGGALFTDRGTEDHLIDIVDSATVEGGTMLWLSRFTHRDAAGNPHWVVRAVLPLRPVGDDETLVFAPGTCRVGGTPDPGVVAIAVWRDAEVFTEIRRAWRANRERGAFESVDETDVECDNMEYGV